MKKHLRQEDKSFNNYTNEFYQLMARNDLVDTKE